MDRFASSVIRVDDAVGTRFGALLEHVCTLSVLLSVHHRLVYTRTVKNKGEKNLTRVASYVTKEEPRLISLHTVYNIPRVGYRE